VEERGAKEKKPKEQGRQKQFSRTPSPGTHACGRLLGNLKKGNLVPGGWDQALDELKYSPKPILTISLRNQGEKKERENTLESKREHRPETD